MNKKLIAVAIAAVVAAPAAMAETTLYGKAHVDIRSDDRGAIGDAWTVNSNASRLGVKGSEDLGNGLKAIFKYETTVEITDGGANGGTFGSARNAYVGLAGNFGTFLAGRHDTPAKVALYGTGGEMLGDSIIDFNASGGRVGFTERRVDNAIAYISPSMSGFTVAAATVTGEQFGGPANNLTDAYSLAAMYSGMGLKAGIGYEVLSDDLTGGQDDSMWQAGASYTFGDFTVAANYEDRSDIGGVAGRDTTTWGVSGKANFGNNYVTANWINQDPSAGSDVDRFGIAAGHKFSKRTQAYVAYMNQDNPVGGDWDQFALGMIHDF